MNEERRGAPRDQRNIDDDMPMAQGPGVTQQTIEDVKRAADITIKNWQSLHDIAASERNSYYRELNALTADCKGLKVDRDFWRGLSYGLALLALIFFVVLVLGAVT